MKNKQKTRSEGDDLRDLGGGFTELKDPGVSSFLRIHRPQQYWALLGVRRYYRRGKYAGRKRDEPTSGRVEMKRLIKPSDKGGRG